MNKFFSGPLRAVYEKLTGWIHTRWTGGLQAAYVVRSLNLRAAFRAQPPPEGARVLDAGCGEGASLAALLSRRFPLVHFYAADLFIQAQYALPPNLHLLVHDVQKSLPESGFYAVYSMDLLEHVEEPRAVLKNFFDAIVPGGRLFLHIPSSSQFHYFESAREGYRPSFRETRRGDLHLREGFSEEDLAGLLSKQGFSDIRFRRTFSPPVFFFKELYTLGERLGIPGTGILLLPFMLLFGTAERIFPPERGNGIWVEAVRSL